MAGEALFNLLGNATLLVHVSIALFVVAGLPLIVVGNLRRWRWVNRMAFRSAHLAAIAVVVAESWFGLICPLTTLEMYLRTRAGTPAYAGGFIEHWFQSLLYYKAPSWVFILAYTGFGLLVAATWWLAPPRRRGSD